MQITAKYPPPCNIKVKKRSFRKQYKLFFIISLLCILIEDEIGKSASLTLLQLLLFFKKSHFKFVTKKVQVVNHLAQCHPKLTYILIQKYQK